MLLEVVNMIIRIEVKSISIFTIQGLKEECIISYPFANKMLIFLGICSISLLKSQNTNTKPEAVRKSHKQLHIVYVQNIYRDTNHNLKIILRVKKPQQKCIKIKSKNSNPYINSAKFLQLCFPHLDHIRLFDLLILWFTSLAARN